MLAGPQGDAGCTSLAVDQHRHPHSEVSLLRPLTVTAEHRELLGFMKVLFHNICYQTKSVLQFNSSGLIFNEVFQLTHRSLTQALRCPNDEAAMSFYLVLFNLSHITGENFTSFHLFVFGLFETENVSLCFGFAACFSELQCGRLVTQEHLQSPGHRNYSLILTGP